MGGGGGGGLQVSHIILREDAKYKISNSVALHKFLTN